MLFFQAILGYGCNYRFSDACTSNPYGVPNSHCDTSEPDTPRWATCQCDEGYGYVKSNPTHCQGKMVFVCDYSVGF